VGGKGNSIARLDAKVVDPLPRFPRNSSILPKLRIGLASWAYIIRVSSAVINSAISRDALILNAEQGTATIDV
jgi:hypothetical protein